MLFSSVVFIFFFLPFVLTLYFYPSNKWRNSIFLLASFLFYFWTEGGYVLVLLISILINYGFGLWFARSGSNEVNSPGTRFFNSRKSILVCGLIFNLALLVFFKYAGFLFSNINGLLDMVGMPPIHTSSVYTPLGISFFTFHALSYLIDVYRNEAPAQNKLGSVALYMAAFPKLLAGPIAQYRQAADELAARRISCIGFLQGVERFVTGLAKKVLLANPLSAVADAAFALRSEDMTPFSAWTGVLCFTLQIYFDFSGYSDMAIGLGKMFGFNFPENFNFPYISQSVREFWQRWHISLSAWFREYLYIPLGGNRCTPLRNCFNLIVVFLLCGLWHGASWNFIIWGAWYGLFLVLERTWPGKLVGSAPRPLRHIYLLLVVVIGWVFFRAENLPLAVMYLKSMFGFHLGTGNINQFAVHLNTEVLFLAAVAGVLCLPVSIEVKRLLRFSKLCLHGSLINAVSMVIYVFYGSLLGCMFLASIMSVAGGTHKAFIYLKF